MEHSQLGGEGESQLCHKEQQTPKIPAIDISLLKQLDEKTKIQGRKLKMEKHKTKFLTDQLKDKEELLKSLENKLKFEIPVLEERCRSLENMLDESTKQVKELQNERMDDNFKVKELEKRMIEINGELCYFKAKYKDEYEKDKAIIEKSAEIKNLKNEVKLLKEQSFKCRDNVTQLLVDATHSKALKDLQANLSAKEVYIDELEKKILNISKKHEETNFSSINKQKLIQELEQEIEDLSLRILNHEFDLEEERRAVIEQMKKEQTGSKSDQAKIRVLESEKKSMKKLVKKRDEDIAILLRKLKTSVKQLPRKSKEIRGESKIIESMVSNNTLLQSENSRLNKDKRRLKAMMSSYKEQLDLKEENLMKVTQHLCDLDSKFIKRTQEKLTKKEDSRVKNGMYNKSLADMRQLIGKVIIENIGLKRENEKYRAKLIMSG